MMMYHLHVQPSEVESLDFYEYYYILENLIEILEEQNKGSKDSPDQKSIMKEAGKMIPKQPKFDMPKLTIPKIR